MFFLLYTAGHVFAYGLSRSAAITNMSLALKEIQICGEIHSNVDYTVDLLNVRILIAPESLFCLSILLIHV
jgi:biotin carboxylase